MNVFSLFPGYNEGLTKVANRLDPEKSNCVFAFDSDWDDVTSMQPGDIFVNRDDDCLYKVAAVEPFGDDDQYAVQTEKDFTLSVDEFTDIMRKVAEMDDDERRHLTGDSIMAHTFKQVAPEYAYGINTYVGMGKLYS